MLPFAQLFAKARALLFTTLLVAANVVLAASSAGAVLPNKCTVNGQVTYQQTPCASAQPRKLPTLEELNAEQTKRRAAAVSATPDRAATAASAQTLPAPAALVLSKGIRCDGRRYCTQMTSCAEAKYFLANCPGVKLDGDNDGIPCEEQWCQRQ